MPLRVLAFIMAAIYALLAGENAHPRGQLESEKTNRRMQILQVRLKYRLNLLLLAYENYILILCHVTSNYTVL